MTSLLMKRSSSNVNVKVSLVGTTNVGKTSLLMRIIKNEFVTTTATTSMAVHPFQVQTSSGAPMTISFWDTAGQERFKGLASMYYHGCAACIAVFDISAADTTLDAMAEYIKIYRETCGQDAKVVVAANKLDLIEYDSAMIVPLMEKCENLFQARMFCTSAKTGEGVADLLAFLVGEVEPREELAVPSVKVEVELTTRPETPNKSCC